tara:strand:- start:311 stop:565 length:255 start_codon:yes stop_codon:yes gene_type:complete
MSKYNVNIQHSHGSFYKVSLTDNYGAKVVVYEESVEGALNYAKDWFFESDTRHKADRVHAKAIAEMIKIDREAGITTSQRDSLD